MKKIFFILICLILGALAFAQSAEKVDEMLESKFLTKGQACYLAGIAIEEVKETDSYEEAFNKFKGLKMFKDAAYDEPIRFDEFANLALQYSSIKKGLWYGIAKNPHYAFRQLKLMRLIPQNTLPSSNISPSKAMNLLTKIMSQSDN